MIIEKVLKLRGPNVWANFPVLEAWVHLEELKDTPSHLIPGFNERIIGWLPSMIEHRCGIGERGGFFQRLHGGTYMGHVLEHVTLELQTLAGSNVGFGRARETSVEGVYKVAIEYLDEKVGLASLDTAFRLLQGAIQGHAFDVEGEIEKLRELAHEVCMGPSTSAIVGAATERGIPHFRLDPDCLVQLGYGSAQRRINAAETANTSAIAEMIAQDKQLTRQLLRSIGVPVPKGRVVVDAKDACLASEELGVPVVVKPQFGNHGRGVTTNLSGRDQILAAFQMAIEECSSVVVETFAPGDDYRLLVVGERLVAAARREPAHVIGDGHSTIRQLVEIANRDPLRSDGHATALSRIKLDAVAESVLASQGFAPESVPKPNVKVLIRRNANLSTGGTATDVTDLVHPDIADQAVAAARMVGLDIAGVDVVVQDISRPLMDQGGVIVEVNAEPGLRMHLRPSSGTPRAVGQDIINMLFPEGQSGRVPIVAVTGVNGKTTTTRLVAHILATAGRRVGMTCTDGIFISGRRIDRDDCSGPQSARSVLMNPQVDAAVLETARGGILREGLAFDRCDIGIVTNIADGDHLGLSDVQTPEQLAQVKRCVVEAVAETGTAVLNANDPLVAAMAAYCPGDVIFFSIDADRPSLAQWRSEGGRVVSVHDNAVSLAEGSNEFALLSLERIPLVRGGQIRFQVENVLAAAAACWALGVPCEQIRLGLESFAATAEGSPARFCVFDLHGSTMIVDYGHNTSSLAAVLQAIESFPNRRRTAVYSTAGDRRDDDMIRQGQMLGDAFDRVVLYEDQFRRGRATGEIIEKLREGLARGKRVTEVQACDNWADAVSLARRLSQPGELQLVQADTIDEAVKYFGAHFATPLQEVRNATDVTVPRPDLVGQPLSTAATAS